MKLSFKKMRVNKKTGLAVSFVIAFIAAVCMFNVFINSMTEKFSWYFYTAEKYEHSIGRASENVLAPTYSTQKTQIYFCMPKEELTGNNVYDLVWETAVQFSQKYEFIEEPKTLNTFVFSDAEKIKEYVYDEEGNAVNSIDKKSVIIDSGENFRVLTLSDFFLLDDSGSIVSYKGEEIMAAVIKGTRSGSTKKVLFTSNHGETSTQALFSLLACSGYEVSTTDLTVEEIGEDVDFIFVCSPIYDFEKVKEGSGIRSETEKLKEFVARGGNLIVMKDPYTDILPNLEGVLSDFGLTLDRGIVSDGANSVSTNGRTPIAYLSSDASDGTSSSISAKISDNDGRIAVSESAAIIISPKNGIICEKLLVSSDKAKINRFDGTETEGEQVLAAIATGEADNFGSISLFASPRLFSASFIDTDAYANRDFVYAFISVCGNTATPVGATRTEFENTRLENLTVGESNVYAVLLAVVIPSVVVAVGAVILIRRRRR